MNAALRGRQVLIIEDEALVSLMIQDMLHEMGCRIVGVATSQTAALAAVERSPAPDAVVLDLNLDGSRSYPVADALAARGVPFVIVTGYSEEAVAEARRQYPVLRKPFREADLARALATALGAASPASAQALVEVTHAR